MLDIMEKIYIVKFMQYTSCMNDTVTDGNGNYIKIGRQGFLVPERRLAYYENFGEGYRSVEFVGNMLSNEFNPINLKGGEADAE